MSEIETILQKFPNSNRENLLPILQDIQKTEGYISEDAVVKVGAWLKIPTSKVFAVSTFYDKFRFAPGAKYNIYLCQGTACHLEGSGSLLKELEKILGISDGQSTKDKMFSIETTPCIGACGKAPALKINNNFYTDVTKRMIAELIISIKEKEGL